MLNPTPRQRLFIRRLRLWRKRPPTTGRLVLQLLAMLTGWTLALTVVTLAAPSEYERDVGMISYGIVLGFMGSGIAQIRLARSRWPVYEEVLDWSKLESMDPEE